MHDLIPLADNDGSIAVMGRDLHDFLEVESNYTTWFSRMVEYGFLDGQDFIPEKESNGRGRPKVGHIITLDMAKEISMLQRTEKGKQARQYFIECEKIVKLAPAPQELSRKQILTMALEAEDRAELEAERADKAEHKAEILTDFKRAHEAGDGITVSDFGRKYFSEEQYMQVFNHLYKYDYLIDQRGTRATHDGKKKDGHDHMKPKAKGRKYFYLHEKGTHGGQRRNQTRVRPQGEIALRDALIADGLTPNTHSTGLVLFNSEDIKEI